MKKLLYILPLAVIVACGGGAEQEGGAEGEGAEATQENAANAAAMESVDLSTYGWDYTIDLPKKDMEANIMENNWGGLDIQYGQNFWLTVNYGEGDLDIKKFDLEEAEFYVAEILDESENHILYKLTDKAGSLKPTFHLYYTMKLADGDAIEIENSKDADFNEDAARSMLASAMTLKAKGGA